MIVHYMVDSTHFVSVPSVPKGDENHYHEDLADAVLAKAVLKDLRSDEQFDLDSFDKDMQNSTVPSRQQAEILTSAFQVFESEEIIHMNLIRGLRSLRRSVTKTTIQSMQQSSIDTFFKR